VRGAAHFSRPEDDGFIQHSALMQVGDEGGDGLLGDAGILFVIQLELSVLVPWRVVAIATVSKFSWIFRCAAGGARGRLAGVSEAEDGRGRAAIPQRQKS